jgi:CBS domain-containing protein
MADQTGIITERDVMRVLASTGAAALQMTVDDIASRPLATVPAQAFVYLAIARMNRLRVRYLGAVDMQGHIVGALSPRDLLRLRAEGSIALGDELEHAVGLHALGRAWAKLPLVAPPSGQKASRVSKSHR